jgi:DNA-3-methyladenine glycosylase
MESPKPLSLDFYDRGPATVAQDLLGKLLVRRMRGGLCIRRIVETEAYLGSQDAASHSFRGQTRRNATMFGPPGRAYVYRIHQVFCVNVVTEATATAVLIRALEPLSGLAATDRDSKLSLREATRGPGRLCRALEIDLRLDGWDLTQGRRLWIADDPAAEGVAIGKSPRIGVGAAKDLLLRFFIEGNPCVSKTRRMQVLNPEPGAPPR